MAARRAAAPAAERLLREEVAATTEWLAGRAAVTAARAIQDHLERVRREELEKFESRLRRLDPDERELVERITKSILKTMLHRPLRSLRDPVHGSDLAGALSRLFGLDRDPDAPTPMTEADGQHLPPGRPQSGRPFRGGGGRRRGRLFQDPGAG